MGGGVILWPSLNPKSLNLAKFSFMEGGFIPIQIQSSLNLAKIIFFSMDRGGSLAQLKSKVPQYGQVFIFGGSGGGYSGPTEIQSAKS